MDQGSTDPLGASPLGPRFQFGSTSRTMFLSDFVSKLLEDTGGESVPLFMFSIVRSGCFDLGTFSHVRF